MHISCTIFFLLFSFLPQAIAQQAFDSLWTVQTNNDGGGAERPIVTFDKEHNIIICERAYHPGPVIGFYTAKISRDGTKLWENVYNGPGQDYIRDCIVDSEGNVFVCGTSYSLTGNHPIGVVFKYSPDGQELWKLEMLWADIQKSTAFALAKDENDNIYVGGTKGTDCFIAKLSDSGKFEWEFHDQSTALGALILIGKFWENKIIMWGLSGSTEGTKFGCWQLNTQGQLLGFGQTDSTVAPFTLVQQPFTLDTKGNLLWGSYNNKYLVTKYNKDGSLGWAYRKASKFPAPNWESPYVHSCADPENNVYLFGNFWTDSTSKYELLTTKLSEDGEVLWEKRLPTTCYAKCAVADSQKIILGGGHVIPGLTSDSDYSFYAYSSDGERFARRDFDFPSVKNSARAITMSGEQVVMLGNYYGDNLRGTSLLKAQFKGFTSFAPFLISPQKNFSLFPNPSNGLFNLRLHDWELNNSLPIWVQVFDAAGRLVKMEKLLTNSNYAWQINGSKLPSGIYTIKLLGKFGAVSTEKLTIQK